MTMFTVVWAHRDDYTDIFSDEIEASGLAAASVLVAGQLPDDFMLVSVRDASFADVFREMGI